MAKEKEEADMLLRQQREEFERRLLELKKEGTDEEELEPLVLTDRQREAVTKAIRSVFF